MVTKRSSSDVYAPNSGREPISDDDLIRGFVLALVAGGRKSRTLFIYEDKPIAGKEKEGWEVVDMQIARP